MIVNLDKFLAEERPRWERLDQLLRRQEEDPWRAPGLEEARELDYLYRRAAADLAKVATFSAEPEMRAHLERLVARGYAVVHGGRARRRRAGVWSWVARTLPRTFRRHARAFLLACAVTAAGAMLGGAALALDPEAKEVIMPFPHLLGRPSERVAQEEAVGEEDRLAGGKTAFSAQLMTHNTRVAIFAMALGMTWGVGTLIVLFYNGIVLGAVVVDYVLDGQSVFLAGWLLPHGIVEIPAILVAAQAGLVLASALLGRGQPLRLSERMRAAAPDVATLIAGAGLLLVWAGVVEAFLSQYHEPVLPYAVKILFGMAEGGALVAYLALAGRRGEEGQ